VAGLGHALLAGPRLSFGELTRIEAATTLGVVPVWRKAGAAEPGLPGVVAIQGLLAGPEDLASLPVGLGRVAEACVLRLPGAEAPALRETSMQAAARAVGEVIVQLFPDRPVVLLGVSAGAVVALGVRAPNLRRIVAVEPTLRTGELWPLQAVVRDHLAPLPRDAAAHRAFAAYMGLGARADRPRDDLALLDRLDLPTDVILAGEPLEPRREAARLPSLVDATVRARLAAHPRVRLHLAAGSGHNAQGAAPKLLRDVLFEACRRASAETIYEPRELDEPLVEATPLTAARVLHWGPGGRAFAGAFLSWNPTAEVAVLGDEPDAQPEPGGAYDALALGAPPPPGLLSRLAPRLAQGGHLVARGRPSKDDLSAHGLAPREPVDEAGTGVLRAQKTGGAPARPALRLETVAFAHFLMDVRSRLPARGLRTDPELEAAYVTAPHDPSVQPPDRPKVLVLQRPGPTPIERGRRMMAHAMSRGWLAVIEYDDHPGLVAEALGRPFTADDLARFGYAHAVQTTTEPLRELFLAYVPEVRVFENAAFELAPFPRKDRPRRVFYGAVSRGAFGVAVARSLAPVVQAFPDVEFVVLGDREVFEALPTRNKAFETYLPYEAYLARMARCAVSLSPVDDHPLRLTKSDAKFVDAARAGVVTIGSPAIYARTIRHGENGLLAAAVEDWAPQLIQALGDLPLRRAMARTAWDEVRNHRMFAGQVAARRDWYRDLWARRDALYASALARIPGLTEALAAERAALG